MHWLNEPASWQRTDDVLRVSVDPGTDFWRATGYGYIHDNGHVYGDRLPGDLDVSVRMRGTFAHQYDQAGIMLRADEQTWLKTGVEFFEGRLRLSTVLTLGWSSWIVADLPADLDEITLRVSRRGDAVEVRYAAGEGTAELAALVFMPPDCELMAGIMCAAPEGSGFIVTFHDLRIAGREWGAPQPGQPAAEWAGQPADEWAGDTVAGPSPDWDGQHHSNGTADWYEVPAGQTRRGWPDGPGAAGRMPAEWADEQPAGLRGEWADGQPADLPAEWADGQPADLPAEWGEEQPGHKSDRAGEQPAKASPPWPELQGSEPPASPVDEDAGDMPLLDWAQPLASDAATDWDRLSGSLAAKHGSDQAADPDKPGKEPAAGGKKTADGKKTAGESTGSLPDDKTDPVLPAATSPAKPALPARKRSAPKLPGPRKPAPPAEADAADEWISLLTADPAEE
jgi:uncharacterized protein